MNYETIFKNYQRGLWNEQMVQLAVTKGIITAKEYQNIIDNKPINYDSLTETIEELSSVLENAESAVTEGVESIG